MIDFSKKTCKPCEGNVLSFSREEAEGLLKSLPTPTWQLSSFEPLQISKLFEFKNYYHTMAFVNMLAWISHQENHHPNLEVGYNTCKVIYYTHSIKGLSENDFICAAKIDNLLLGNR